MEHFVWDISPEIFRVGPLAVRWYGLLFALGFIIGYELFQWFFKIEKKNIKDIDKLTIVMIIATVVGARLGHCFFYEPQYYLANPIEILMIWKGGLASHGAAIGILLGIWIFVLQNKQYKMMWILDRLVIAIALSGALIRLGNFFNSEILGLASDSSFAIIFASIDQTPRHPVQLYEAFSYLLIFAYLLFVYNRHRIQLPAGRLFGAFLTLVFSARFVLEYFKEFQTSLENDMILRMGQVLSIPFVLVGLYFWIKSYLSNKTTKMQ
jgi:prolipoprotein diacylglyceryl transferase